MAGIVRAIAYVRRRVQEKEDEVGSALPASESGQRVGGMRVDHVMSFEAALNGFLEVVCYFDALRVSWV